MTTVDIALSYEYMLMNLHFTTVKTKIAKQNYFSLAVVGMLLKPDMGKDSICPTHLTMPQTVKLPRAVVVSKVAGWVLRMIVVLEY